MKTYKDNLPLNANVTVDYTKKGKDKVKFDYPIVKSYKKAVWYEVYLTITALWLKIWALILYPPAIAYGIYLYLSYLNFDANISQTFSSLSLYEIFSLSVPFIVVGYFMFGIPAIITYYLSLDKEKLSKYMPKIGVWITLLFGKVIVKKFTPEDIEHKEISIPRFKNILLDYKTTGDFSKHLKRIEVRDIPIKNSRNDIYIALKRVRKKYPKKQRQNTIFSANFTFDKIPNNGNLIVKYI